MSSTSIYKGSFGEKPSSRVLRPPGGGSSNIFGFGAEDPPKATQTPKQAEIVTQAAVEKVENKCAPSTCSETKDATLSTAVSSADATKQEKVENKCAPSTCSETKDATMSTAVSSADATKQEVQPPIVRKNRSSGFNPITGEPYGSTVVQPAYEKKNASIAVKQPPGGASSGLW